MNILSCFVAAQTMKTILMNHTELWQLMKSRYNYVCHVTDQLIYIKCNQYVNLQGKIRAATH